MSSSYEQEKEKAAIRKTLAENRENRQKKNRDDKLNRFGENLGDIGGASGLSWDRQKDLTSALEHIAMVGGNYRHKDFQIKEWNKQGGFSLSSTPMSNPSYESTATIGEKDNWIHKKIHAKDARQYGVVESVGQPWSKRRKITQDDQQDIEWHRECSDDFYHPIRFYNDRLSEYPPTVSNDRVDADTTTSTAVDSSSNCTIAEGDANRAILLHCWERAMSAASSVLFVSKTLPSHGDKGIDDHDDSHDDMKEIIDSGEHSIEEIHLMRQAILLDRRNAETSSNPNGTEEDKHKQVVEEQVHGPSSVSPHSRLACEDKCRKLKIELPSISPYKCPTCTVNFDSQDQLKDHFFGTGESPTRGGCCSVSMIRNQHCQIVNHALHASVTAQLNHLIRIVTSSSGGSVQDWRFVVHSLTKYLEQGHGDEEAVSNDARMSLRAQITPPLIQTVTRRLVERYGKVPR